MRYIYHPKSADVNTPCCHCCCSWRNNILLVNKIYIFKSKVFLREMFDRRSECSSYIMNIYIYPAASIDIDEYFSSRFYKRGIIAKWFYNCIARKMIFIILLLLSVIIAYYISVYVLFIRWVFLNTFLIFCKKLLLFFIFIHY